MVSKARTEGRLFQKLKWPEEVELVSILHTQILLLCVCFLDLIEEELNYFKHVQRAQVSRLYSLLTIKDSAANIPNNLEARRRLEFFTNSLFMEMPVAKPVREMLSFRQLIDFELNVFRFSNLKLATHVMLLVFYAVCSLRITPRLCFTACLNSLRKTRMVFQLCFTSKRYIQVTQLLFSLMQLISFFFYLPLSEYIFLCFYFLH